MKRIIIRDDDFSALTNFEDIYNIYDGLIKNGYKISLATIPRTYKSFNLGVFNKFYQDYSETYSFDPESKLTSYIKDGIREGSIEIMLHGYNHGYYVSFNNEFRIASLDNLEYIRRNNFSYKFVGEFAMGSYDSLNFKLVKGKAELEDIFETKIKNFVPPSNQIGKNGILALINNKLNMSGLISEKYDREITIKGLFNYIKRLAFLLFNNEYTYPYITDYGLHKELVGYALTNTTNLEKYIDQIYFCSKHNLPFQIATHYWELDNKLINDLHVFLTILKKLEYEPFLLKDILK